MCDDNHRLVASLISRRWASFLRIFLQELRVTGMNVPGSWGSHSIALELDGVGPLVLDCTKKLTGEIWWSKRAKHERLKLLEPLQSWDLEISVGHLFQSCQVLRTVVFKHTKPEDSFDVTTFCSTKFILYSSSFFFLGGGLRANCTCSNFSSVLIKSY